MAVTEALLPYARFPEFLAHAERAQLLDYVLQNEEAFFPATVRSADESIVNRNLRVGLVTRDLGALRPLLERRFLDSLPELMRAIGAPELAPPIVELELAAHGDGAFYRRHTDIPIGETRKRRSPEPDRIISAVYYFHREPKGFSGGQLRLFSLDGDEFADLEPVQNSLVVFHSWVAHEVRPIRCPSGRFRDYRFAINCWFRRSPAS